jgi:acyl transferase domain-containing protein
MRLYLGIGSMAAVGLSWEEAEKYLVPGVVVACDNSPSSVTLSGDAQELEEVVAAIKSSLPNVLATILKVEKAYHSHHMVEIGEEYFQAMNRAHVKARTPSMPFFSSVTGSLLRNNKMNENPLVSDHSLQSVSSCIATYQSRCRRCPRSF